MSDEYNFFNFNIRLKQRDYLKEEMVLEEGVWYMVKKITILKYSENSFTFKKEGQRDESSKYNSYENTIKEAIITHCKQTIDLPSGIQFDLNYEKKLNHIKFIIHKHPNNRFTLKEKSNGSYIEYDSYFNSYEDAAIASIKHYHQEHGCFPQLITFYFEENDTWIVGSNN